ncbi:MAG: hypothetical protein ACOX6U_08500 [Oscillospiraceae bacterium]|jgi:hypothetical protein
MKKCCFIFCLLLFLCLSACASAPETQNAGSDPVSSPSSESSPNEYSKAPGVPAVEITAAQQTVDYSAVIKEEARAQEEEQSQFAGMVSAVDYADVVVVKTGEALEIRFPEQIPDSAECVDYMLQGGGSYKGHVMFQQSLYEPFALNLENGVAAYPVERHPLYGLASSPQTLRGIRLICTFGSETVEYRFLVRHVPDES